MADIDASNAKSFATTQTAAERKAATNRGTIEALARDALATNRTYLGITSPTATQTAAQVKALSRQMNGVIRLVLNALEAAD